MTKLQFINDMTESGSAEQIRHLRIRNLEEVLEGTTERAYSFRSFDGQGTAVTIFNWVMIANMVMVLICIIHKRSRSDDIDISLHPNATAGPNRSPEQEEAMRKRKIFKLYQTEHIQQKITRDQIRQDSYRTIDTATLSSEEFQSSDNHSSDGEYTYDEEEDHGTVVILPFQGENKSKPASSTSTANDDDIETSECGSSNAKGTEKSESSCTTSTSNDDPEEKAVSNLCTICLEEYHEGETIVWSSNKNCRHAFHRDCLTNYLVKVKDQSTYPCPICRQNFFYGNECKTCEKV